MAENTIWLHDDYFDEAKIVVWGHNYHVSRTNSGPAMGEVLSDNYGSGYHVVGFTFSTGSFRAVEYSNNQYRGLRTMSISTDPVPGSLNGLFSEANTDNFMIDLSLLSDQPQWRSLFLSNPDVLSLGAVYNLNPLAYYEPFIFNHYDDLIHIDRTTAVDPL